MGDKSNSNGDAEPPKSATERMFKVMSRKGDKH